MKIGVSSQLLEHTRYKRLIVCNESVFDNGSDRGSDTVGRCGSREDPDIQDRSGYRTSMYDAVWDPDGLWTQKAAEELLRNTREYYSGDDAAQKRGDRTGDYTWWKNDFYADMLRLPKKINGDPSVMGWYPAFEPEPANPSRG